MYARKDRLRHQLTFFFFESVLYFLPCESSADLSAWPLLQNCRCTACPAGGGTEGGMEWGCGETVRIEFVTAN